MDSNQVIDRINEDIVEVISHFVALTQKGTNYIACCPFHNEDTPSFVVSEAKGIFKCFGCGKGGDAITFIREHENVDFKEAVEIGAKKLNIDFEWQKAKDFDPEKHAHKESLQIVTEKATRFFSKAITKNLVAKKYLKSRGFIPGKDDVFRVGYAPSGNVLREWAKKEALKERLLVELGLLGLNKDTQEPYDFFRNRIIFPICDRTGKVIAFTGRTLPDSNQKAKYLNSKDSVLYNKSESLFGLNIARRTIRGNRAYLVEGNFDVMQLHQIGITNAVAPCGTALTIGQAKLLKKYTKNITLIYDGDAAGRKAVLSNGELLVKQQFNVSVIILPDKEDPASFFKTSEQFEEYKDEHHEDYIMYRVQQGEKLCKNPAYKSEFIKSIADLITRYDEPSMHEVYLEEVSKIIKPKKAWQDQVKLLVADKTPTEPKSYIPKNVSVSEFQERGFYAQDNCYFFADKTGVPHQHSNFVMTPIFHIESAINAKRLYEVKNVHNQVRVIEIPQKDLISRTAFMVHIESLGNFWWDGSESDLNRLKRWLYEKTESCKEITQLGWQKEGFFAWGNGIYNSEYKPVDSYGIVKHGKRSFYIPAFSSIYEEEDGLFQFERKFIHMEGNITLREYAKKFTAVFGNNAKIAMAFYFASLFRDVVVRKFGIFPILNMFGPKGAGKTACAESIVQFFGRLSKAPNVHNTSKAALADHVATSINAICHIDEYRNDLDMEKREFLKGLWDGIGRTRMNMDKDKKKETTRVEQAVILTGQQMATADIALFSRFIYLSFTQVEYSNQEKINFQQLKDIEKRGLTHITHKILSLRHVVQDTYHDNITAVSNKMSKMLGKKVVEDRIFNNWLIPLSVYATLEEHIELDWSIDEMVELGVELMLNQNKETKKNDDLGNFWKVVEYMASSNMLFDGGDYKVELTQSFTRRFYDNGKWQKEVHNFPDPVEILYLTKNRVFNLYKTQCLREGDKPLPEATIEYYLTHSPAFLGETKKESFKKIDPRTGLQDTDENGNKKRTSTTAMIFNYAQLSINLTYFDSEEDSEVNTPKKDKQKEFTF